MPGAWEIEPPSVLVAILTRELVSTRWALGLRRLQVPASASIIAKSGGTFDYMRNMACEDALRHGFTWLLFLDDDVVPPPDVFARLAAHGKDIVSGLYYRRHDPLTPCAIVHDGQDQAQWVTSFPAAAVVEVDYVGAGCLLIHRRVLERMPAPWFVWQQGRADLPPPHLSEDFAFCRRAKREFGFGIWLDTSVRCEHIGMGKVDHEGFHPAGAQ